MDASKRTHVDAADPADLPVAWQQVLSEFGSHLRFEAGKSSHTVRAYVADVSDLLSYVHSGATDSLGLFDIKLLRGWLAHRRHVGAARASLARHVSAVRVFTAWCHHNGYMSTDPGVRLSGPKVPHNPPTVLASAQAEALIDTAGRDLSVVGFRDRAVLEMLYATGIRVSELCGLDMPGVDLTRGVIRVFGKGAKERMVPFGQPAAKALQAYLTHSRAQLLRESGGDALFLGVRGGRLHPSSVRRLLRNWLAEAGVSSITPHGLRHAAATHLLDGGADLRSVQELLGHASIDSTQIYTHVTAERLRGAFDQAHPRA